MATNEQLEGKPHWVFKKHTNDIKKFIDCAIYLKDNNAAVSQESKSNMLHFLQDSNLYKSRLKSGDEVLDAMNHRIDGLNYYMFGYSSKLNGKKKFIFSPLGNLFLKHLGDKKKLEMIFATMLFAIQFPHPASRPSLNFSLYPFRLIFQLLLDSRLAGKLYNYELISFLIYVDKLNQDVYEELVAKILESRKLTSTEKLSNLKRNEHQIVKSVYEWQYYNAKLISSLGVITTVTGDESVKLYHPTKEGSKSAPTPRKISDDYFSLTETVTPYVKKMLSNYSVFETPIALNNRHKKSDDVIKAIYSFYPSELLSEIGEEQDATQVKLLKLPRLIEEYSTNPDNKTADKFEDILEEAFNMFINVDATKLSGPGRTDIECLYITENEKFAVEAKSTANKLNAINSGRLYHHRQLIGAKYTVVVTPHYVPSVKFDISGQDIVIIKANTLSEYLYNNIVSDNRSMDYGAIHEIVEGNLGTDISSAVSDLTLTHFG
ncbi:restriction endonuclease [Leuconostoc mesenteroides]|uniref:restriction endonuclease n=1 Tax=Leuconostoc mesenteroides TaxID=1245 RepID=UPI000E09DD70|nr:restriction endonuclease [Leuconostoc mesenteroides]MBZ1502364.1 restriction endonuclease [Leuconostoc mesenteroides]RDF91967.1 restriction endonuclease [Leuconostoc mesenteroides subsp. mesenteroides]